jgi:hypothetical protein
LFHIRDDHFEAGNYLSLAYNIDRGRKRAELAQLRTEFDRQMLRKVHAGALLQWRGYQIPPADKLILF